MGITTGSDGHLAINDAKLNDALNGRIAGVTLAAKLDHHL